MPVISALITTLGPVLRDNLSKQAGSATILFIVYQAVKKLGDTIYQDFGIPSSYTEWATWATLVLVLLFAPSDWLKSRIYLIKTLMRKK